MDRKHLLLRGKIWYVILKIPPVLRPIYGGKVHITRTLRTESQSEAQDLRDIEVGAIKKDFRTARENGGLTIAAAHWRERLDRKEPRVISKFTDSVSRVKRLHGDAAAAELANRTFNNFTDLNSGEDAWFKAAEFTRKTEQKYQHSIKLLREHLQRESLEQCAEVVDVKVAASFRRHLVAQEVHRKTADAYLSALRSRWQWWIDEDVVQPPNPFAGLTMPRSKRGQESPRRPWESGELIKLFSSDMDQGLFNIVTMLLLTGARRGDVMALTVGSYRDGWLNIKFGKTDSAVRRVPVAEIIRPAFEKMLEGRTPDERIFPQSEASVTQAFMRHRRSIGLTGSQTVLHSVRYNFITGADEAGCSRHHTQAVVGHGGGTSITDRYSKVNDGPRQQVVESVVSRLPESVKAAISSKFGR